MKKTILLTLTLIISYASIGQKRTLLNLDTAIMEGYYIDPTTSQYYKNLLHKSRIDDGRSQFQFYAESNRPKEILRLNSKGDTLEINSNSIKYIKIDGKTYEIRRTTKLINQEEGKAHYTKEELNFLNSAHGTEDYAWRLSLLNQIKRKEIN